MIQYKADLKSYNTFGIAATAAGIDLFNNLEELRTGIQNNPFGEFMVLGGGSNVLFIDDYSGLVLVNRIKGITVEFENENEVHLKVGAGVIWHDFVLYCVDRNLGGIENLSLIPGSVGASPMQNIGAYGVEIKDVFVSLDAMNVNSFEVERFSKERCAFGYRESVFKRGLKGQYVITNVTYRLTKKDHEFKTGYGAIQDELKLMGVNRPSIKNISDAVIAIRKSKLPDPKEIGNAGSFFKNPVVPISVLENIQKHYENVPNYPSSEGYVKLAAGWLIEQAGWKGKTIGVYGVHKNQALVLVNYGGADGKSIYDLSSSILGDIEEKFGVQLEREVNIV